MSISWVVCPRTMAISTALGRDVMPDRASLSEVLVEYGRSQRLGGVPPERMVVTIKSIAVDSGADLAITGRANGRR
jgi:hypothetical protein